MQDNNENVLDKETAEKEIKAWLKAIDFDGFEFSEEKELKSIDNEDSELNEDEFEDLESKKSENNDSPDMQKSFYNVLLKYAQSGELVFGSDGVVKHTLIKPIMKKNGMPYLETLEYDCDVEYGKFKTKLNELDSNDNTMDSRLYALVSAVTGVGLGVLYKLRMRDAGIARAIALFIG